MRFSACCLSDRLCCFGQPLVGSPHRARYNFSLQAQTRVSVAHWLSPASGLRQVRQDGVAQTLLSVLVRLGTAEKNNKLSGGPPLITAAFASDPAHPAESESSCSC